jgi:plasmid stabilization system protein ParE
MAFRVEITEDAENEARAILEWLISRHAGETGLRWFQGLEEAIASLSELPQRCPVAAENSWFPFEVRHLLYGRKPNVYRVLFTIQGETVYFLHIRHGRRQPLKRKLTTHASTLLPRLWFRRKAVDDIMAAASQLIENDRQRLMDALTADKAAPPHSITELRGLGKEIWQGEDAQEYVNRERDSWVS